MSHKMDSITTPEVFRGEYQYIRLLGEGANGRTWLAKSIISGADVAVKELKFFCDFKQLELFRRESETLEAIRVKGVPKFYKSIYSESEIEPSYLIQEYIPYPSLQVYLDEGRIFSEEEVLRIMSKVSGILFELQNQYSPPILHRDIKPSNILYQESNGMIDVFLIDFGSVANPDKQSEGSTIAGTFGYMSPEQLQGNASLQSDYYSLGATAVQLLTGVSPYQMESDVFRLRFEDVFRDKDTSVSKYFLELLQSMLDPDIEKRPQNSSELLFAIQNVIKHKPPFLNKKATPSFLKRLWKNKIYPFIVGSTKKYEQIGWIQDIRLHTDGDFYYIYTSDVHDITYIASSPIRLYQNSYRNIIKIYHERDITPTDAIMGKVCANQCLVLVEEPGISIKLLEKEQTIYFSNDLYDKYQNAIKHGL